jgi:16S rRNA (cytidine1402-2'-O)-methyltransferase
MQNKGKLFLIPSPIGEPDASQFSEYYKKTVFALTVFVVENSRTARRFLRAIGYDKNFDTDVTFFEIDKHNNNPNWKSFLKETLLGKDTGLLSEAGMPGIADPGAEIINAAHKNNIQVVPLIGPSSLLMALAASGLNGQNFAFTGYLPIDKNERQRKIKYLEQLSFKEKQTQIFIETPYRNNQFLSDLVRQCEKDTEICIASNLTTEKESITTKTAADWRSKTLPDLNKQPTVFLILKR